MKTKSKVLIGLMAACLLGGVGSALAVLSHNAATGSGTAGAFDQAIYLYWGTDSESVTISPGNDLTPVNPVYRSLEVSPKSSASVTGNVTLTFTMAASSGKHVKGVVFTVYKTESLISSDYETAISELSAVVTINGSSETLSGTTNFAVGIGSGVHETKAYYVMKLTYDGSSDTDKTKPMGGQITIDQSFGA